MGSIEDLLAGREDPESFFGGTAERTIRDFARLSFKRDVEGSVNSFMEVLGSHFSVPMTRVQLNQGLDYSACYDGVRDALILDAGYAEVEHVSFPVVADGSLYVPLVHRGVHIGTGAFDKNEIGEEEVACILWCSELFSGHLYQKIEVGQEIAELRYRAEHDSLTGCYNRWAFEDDLDRAMRIAERTEGSVSLVFLDVDDFKAINTKYSHTHGDFVLRELGKVLREIECRPGDDVYRVGGEEFVFLLRDTDKEHARMFGERVRKKVHRHKFLNKYLSPARAREIYRHDFDSTKVRVSMSVSCSDESGGRAQGLYQLAVDRLSDAKADGKGFLNAGERVDPLTKLMRLRQFDKYLADHVRSFNAGKRNSVVNIFNPGSMIAVCVYDVNGMKELEDIPGFDPWPLFADCVASVKNELTSIARWGTTDRIVGVLSQMDFRVGTKVLLERKAESILRMLRKYHDPLDDSQRTLPFAAGVVLYSPRIVSDDVAQHVAREPSVLRLYAEKLYHQAKTAKNHLVIKSYEPMLL
ncbi:GGDEF domain-containing protein [Candidatus Woesearchaeota archaeon]|nr:GGDEF domain-containing protein [Candidatus Woesearchaeota archaeon]